VGVPCEAFVWGLGWVVSSLLTGFHCGWQGGPGLGGSVGVVYMWARVDMILSSGAGGLGWIIVRP